MSLPGSASLGASWVSRQPSVEAGDPFLGLGEGRAHGGLDVLACIRFGLRLFHSGVI
jgi:hypothetical protein